MKLSRIISLIIILLLLISMVPAAFAEETEAAQAETEATEATEAAEVPPTKETSGACGDNLRWELDGGTLTITGSGEMAAGAPWRGHKERIEKVVLSGGVTTVAAEAFAGYENLRSVNFGGSLREIGESAFRECPGLTEIHLPASFRIFGPESFFGCSSLMEVYCAGGMPSFKASCLWTDHQISIYYPSNNPWPEEAGMNLVNNFGGRLALYPMALENMQVSEPEPEPVATVPPTTEPAEVPTEAPETVPAVVWITEPVETTAVTEPEMPEETTEEVVYTLPTMAAEEEEAPEEKDGLNGMVIGIVLIGGVLTFFIVGALVARSVRNKGGRYYD